MRVLNIHLFTSIQQLKTVINSDEFGLDQSFQEICTE